MLGSLQTEKLQGCNRGSLIRDHNLRFQLRGRAVLVRRMWETETSPAAVQEHQPLSTLCLQLCLLPDREIRGFDTLNLSPRRAWAELYIPLSVCWCSTPRSVSSHSGPSSPVPLMAAVSGEKLGLPTQKGCRFCSACPWIYPEVLCVRENNLLPLCLHSDHKPRALAAK